MLSSTEKLYCPVCKEFLGTRSRELFFTANCEECKATYTWWPKTDRPKAVLNRHKDKKCGCDRCGR